MDREKFAGAVSKSRARGRPRKESEDEPQEDKRARGRQAQKNYQLRKQAETNGLRNRIAFLEDAIERMSSEFISFGDRIITSRARPHVLNDLRGTTKRFLDIARTAESLAGDGVASSPSSQPPRVVIVDDQPILERPLSPGSVTPKPILQSCFGERMPVPTTTFDFNPLLTAATPPSLGIPQPSFDQPKAQPQLAVTGRFSPRLGYGLLGAPPVSNSTPESLWSHYLIAGPNSFAMRLYMGTTRLICSIWKGEVSMPGFLPSVGRYRFRHEDPRILVGLLDEQFANMQVEDEKTRSTDPPPSSAAPSTETSVVLFGPSDPLMSASLRRNIFTDASREMGSIREWLDPWNTQQYLTRRWGIQLTSASAQVSTQTLQALNIQVPNLDRAGRPLGTFENDLYLSGDSALQNIQAWGFSGQQSLDQSRSQVLSELQRPEVGRHFNLIVSTQPLAKSLIRDAVCFGEGPRFFKENIDRAAMEFLSGITSSEGVLALPVS